MFEKNMLAVGLHCKMIWQNHQFVEDVQISLSLCISFWDELFVQEKSVSCSSGEYNPAARVLNCIGEIINLMRRGLQGEEIVIT